MARFEDISIAGPLSVDNICLYAEFAFDNYYDTVFGTYVIIHLRTHISNSLQDWCCKSIIETLKCGKLLCRCVNWKLDQLVVNKMLPAKLSNLVQHSQ